MRDAFKKFINMSIWLAIIFFVLRCAIDWHDMCTSIKNKELLKTCYSILGYIGEAVGMSSIIMFCFNQWLWKYKFFNWISGGMPVLAKKYNGKIRYVWNSEEQERDSEIIIKQTFLKISVKLKTEESYSDSITAEIILLNDSYKLIYTYMNTPRGEIHNRSSIHNGTVIFEIENTDSLYGNYYTDRKTCGSLVFTADK